VADDCIRAGQVGEEFVSTSEGQLVVFIVIVFRACKVNKSKVSNRVVVGIIWIGRLIIIEILLAESLRGFRIIVLFAGVITVRALRGILLILCRHLIGTLWGWSIVIKPSGRVSSFRSVILTVCKIVLRGVRIEGLQLLLLSALYLIRIVSIISWSPATIPKTVASRVVLLWSGPVYALGLGRLLWLLIVWGVPLGKIALCVL